MRAVGIEHAAVHLLVMILTGALSYTLAALVIARDRSRDLIALVKNAVARRPAPV